MRDTCKKKFAPRERRAEAFVDFFVQYCLQHFFKTKKEMAKELGIGYQTILIATNTPEKFKGASLVFQELVVYCISKGISLDEISQAFFRRGSELITSSKFALQEPHLLRHTVQSCHGMQNSTHKGKSRSDTHKGPQIYPASSGEL